MNTNGERGLFHDWQVRLFGERAARLSERLGRTHWLSYLLVLSQSIAVVLVLGHAELPLLFSASWAIRALAAMGIFVLVSTVLAADLALLETLRRIPVLARNRQRAQLREHLAYVLFVLVVEASTYAVVMAALDSNPKALVSAQPLIPNAGPIFVFQVILRAILVCWTAVQLVIVRGKLPVLLSTLTATGKEIVGAHVERRLAALDIHDISLPAAFKVYAAMSKPPRRIRTMFNGWLVRRELAAEAEEERQVANVITALEELEQRQTSAMREDAPEPPQPPTTPPEPPDVRTGSMDTSTPPAVLRLPSQRTRRSQRAGGAHTRPVRTGSRDAERRIREVWQPGMSVSAIERAAGVSRSTAHKWNKVLQAEQHREIAEG